MCRLLSKKTDACFKRKKRNCYNVYVEKLSVESGPERQEVKAWLTKEDVICIRIPVFRMEHIRRRNL
jgi:hypothetical protein